MIAKRKPRLSFEAQAVLADAIFHGEFYRCPVTNRILDSADRADDKVLCNCLSARRVGGTHYKAGLERVSAGEYVKQQSLEVEP